jgi:uncharacterized protein
LNARREMRGRENAERSCLVTRAVRPPAEMLRFVVGPDGAVVPDLRAKLPGRGAWVTATRSAVAEAARRGLFKRAFKRSDLTWAHDLAEDVEGMLRQDLLGALSLANKAGVVVTGFAKVEAAIGGGSGGKPGVAALIHAAEAAEDGRRKLAGALRRAAAEAILDVPAIDDLSTSELDMALGRDHVIHAALVAGAGSTGCLARWRRLRAYRGQAALHAQGPTPPDEGLQDPGQGSDAGTVELPIAEEGRPAVRDVGERA